MMPRGSNCFHQSEPVGAAGPDTIAVKSRTRPRDAKKRTIVMTAFRVIELDRVFEQVRRNHCRFVWIHNVRADLMKNESDKEYSYLLLSYVNFQIISDHFVNFNLLSSSCWCIYVIEKGEILRVQSSGSFSRRNPFVRDLRGGRPLRRVESPTNLPWASLRP